MQRYYDTLLDELRGPVQIIVDKSYEDLHPRDCFDDSVTDIEQLCRDIDSCKYDWFMLRVRVLYEGVELAEEYLGGCLYEDAREVLADGTAEDIIYTAMEHAKVAAADMRKKFMQLDLDTLAA